MRDVILCVMGINIPLFETSVNSVGIDLDMNKRLINRRTERCMILQERII